MGAALMVSIGLAALLGSGKPVDVAKLPPPVNAAPAAEAGTAALDAAVRAFSHGKYEAGGGRYFTVAEGTSWQMVVKLLAEQPPLQGKAKPVRYDWARPGLDLIEIFDTGGGKGLAVAMQGRLVGYYPVTFAKS